ncbi:MAG: hypothetical protein C5B46_06160 [Proteobacteria bacterium]|nr:MAG: hypothetical protein C5B46_06160 [Pseudomonadota bacterium]
MAFINPNPQIPNVPLTPELQELLSPATGTPVIMFPVRLETRFFSQPDNSAELRLRVYPDKIHIDTHEPELTAVEMAWGKHFWEQTWRAGADDERKKAAWQQLADRFDARRAAWIARSLKPLNPQDQPGARLSDDEALPKPINFPNVKNRADSWTRAPATKVLPDRWHVFAYAGGTLVVHKSGNAIPPQLATGPDPAKPLPPSDTDFAIDDGMKWMVDFDEAEKVGMGIRIPLAPADPKAFDILLVLGVKDAANPDDATRQLTALLDAHHYTDGLSILLSGTPSNNTADAPSGFNSVDAGQEQSYWAERGNSSFKSGDGSNADVLTIALGLGPNHVTLAHLTNANAQEQADARHMNRALWPATMGYFLLQMMGIKNEGATPLSVDDLRWVRAHFIEYVRAAGPLPALRAGRQPYGLLPATSLNSWKPSASDQPEAGREAALQNLLLKLRDLWRRNLSQVPRLGRSDNPDQDFADVLSTEALSSNYAARHLMGESYLQNLWSAFTSDTSNPWWGAQQELTLATIRGLGFAWNPNLCRATYSGWYKKIGGPSTQLEITNETKPLDPNYIQLLVSAPDVETIRQENFGDPSGHSKPRGLLYLLLRHALLLEYWTAAANLNLRDNPIGLGWSLNREQEIQKIPGVFVPQFQNVWELLGAPLSGITDQPLGQFLHALKTPVDPNIFPHVTTLFETRESLEYLQSVSAAKLQRAFAGTLDLSSHRLDAWITSLATRRLADIRKAQQIGNLLGGYGWVTNLRPGAAPAIDTTPAGEQGTFFRPVNNPGFTQTPSLGQAATVAVLRSGHLTHSDPATKDLLSIDLSSARVRLAAWLLDGVRQGQPLGALLGYRFERRLQEAGLAQFISVFREVAPLVAGKLEQTTQPVEKIAANNVVDGLLLQTKWKAQPNLPALLINLTPQPDPNQTATLQAELNLLDEAVDAVSDALLAETVHHAVQGNPTRTASTLNAIASGEVTPPQLDVTDTPRTGTALTYRVITLFSGPPVLPAAWNPPASSFRSAAEPNLNAWAAQLLGDPRNVRCLVEQIDLATGAVSETKELRLSDLNLAPLDFIYATQGTSDAQPSELEWRILYAMRRKPDGFAPGAVLRISPRRGSDWPAEDPGYGEFAELLQNARKLITGVRGIDGSELDIPERNQPAGIDIDDLTRRADTAAASLRSIFSAIQGLLDNPTNSESLRDAIVRAGQFGTAAPVPLSPVGDETSDRELLTSQLTSIAADFAPRIAKLKELEDAAPSDPARAQLDRLRTIFGDSFVVLPRFSAANVNDLQPALAQSDAIQDGDPLQAVTWFQRAARVRAGLARLNASLAYAESLQTGAQLNLRVAQLPLLENDRWVALPLAPAQSLSTSRFSLVIQAATDLDMTQPLAGALIDEWVELVPNAKETTGVVFQYDQPGTAAPQCILLAVPPDLDSPWSLWAMQQVLLETLDLAMIRAVDPDTLDEVGHYLPGLYFAINDQGETVSTDLTKA